MTSIDDALEENQSHFYSALQEQRQLNLAVPFVRFANDVESLAQNLPLLVLNVDKVVGHWLVAIEKCKEEEEGLSALLQYVRF